MKALQNLASTFFITLGIYSATFMIIVIDGANELGGQGSPQWLTALGYILIAISGIFTLWTIVLLIKKISTKM